MRRRLVEVLVLVVAIASMNQLLPSTEADCAELYPLAVSEIGAKDDLLSTMMAHPEVPDRYVQENIPGLHPSVLQAYRASFHEARFFPKLALRRVTENELQALHGGAFWDRFHQQYGPGALLVLSPIGIAQNQAVMEYSRVSDGQSGQGGVLFFLRRHGHWQLEKNLSTWN